MLEKRVTDLILDGNKIKGVAAGNEKYFSPVCHTGYRALGKGYL